MSAQFDPTLELCIGTYNGMFEESNKPWMLGNLIACGVYGAIFVVSIGYVRTIWDRLQRKEEFTRLQIVLMVYFVMAFTLCTFGLASDIGVTVSLLSFTCRPWSDPSNTFGDMTSDIWADRLGNFCFLFTSWSADILLLWRCIAVYYDLRLIKRFILVLFCLLQAASIALGIVVFTIYTTGDEITNFGDALPGYMMMVEFGTFGQNVMLTGLIVGRLLLHRHRIKKALGPAHGSEYISIVTILVESQALLVLGQALLLVFPIVQLTPYGGRGPAMVFYMPTAYQIVRQLQVLAPIAVIYRVTHGRACDPNKITQVLSTSRPRFNEPMTASHIGEMGDEAEGINNS